MPRTSPPAESLRIAKPAYRVPLIALHVRALLPHFKVSPSNEPGTVDENSLDRAASVDTGYFSSRRASDFSGPPLLPPS